MAGLILPLLFALCLVSCNEAGTTSAPAVPPNEIDFSLDKYEKASNEFVRLSKKLQSGDFSIVALLMDAEDKTKKLASEIQQQAPKMTPAQSQRMAEISSRNAPYLHK